MHKFLGNGFQEIIYQRALAWEMSQAGLSYAREIGQEIFTNSWQNMVEQDELIFVVEAKVMVELKAIIQLEDVHLAQILNYLKAYKPEVALLVNFGSKNLMFKRLVL